jgi:hypothetical protein
VARTSFKGMSCSVARTLDVLGERWTPLILRDILVGVRRFDAIQRNLGISRKVLAERLSALAPEQRTLLEALRATGRRPRLVAASSFAVYGGDLPPVVDDDLRLTRRRRTARTRRSASCWSTTTAARDLSTASHCGYRPSSCGRVCRTAPPRPLPPR